MPYQLTNGTIADAPQVMANFNALLACLNRLGSAAYVDASAFQPSGQFAQPTSGATVSVLPIGPEHMVKLKPSATLAGLTITFPVSAMDNQIIRIVTTQAITSLTLNGASFDGTTLSTLAAGGSAAFVYSANDGKFTRFQ